MNATVRLLSSVVLLLAATAAQAATWYWRPYEAGPYGRADGSSHANAWQAASAIRWSALKPGDTLYICGLHDAGGDDYRLQVAASGTAGAPITISGACPGDPGRIIGAGARWTSGWTGPDAQGVFSRDYGGGASQMLDAEGYLQRFETQPDESWPCRSFAQIGRTVYYKPCGAPRTVYPAGGSPIIRINGRNHVHIDQLEIMNASRLVEVSHATGFRLTGSHLRYAGSGSIMAFGATSHGVIRGNHIHDVGNGPYFVTGNDRRRDSHDDWIVEDNHIHDVYGSGDAHCIGWQTGSRNIVRRNDLHDCDGSGITFYDPGDGARLKDNVIEDNVIRNVRTRGRGGDNQRGIEVNGKNCPRHPDDAVGNIVRRNRITTVDGAGLFIKAARPTAAGVYSWAFTDNRITDVGDGVTWVDAHGYGTAKPGARTTDPCHPDNLVAELSAPGFLLAGNTIESVQREFLGPKPLNPQQQARDRSGISIQGNTYLGAGRFGWQGVGAASCPGQWVQGTRRCSVDSLAKFQRISGQESASETNTVP